MLKVIFKLKCVHCKHRWELVNHRGDDHPMCPLCMSPGTLVKVTRKQC